MNPNIELGSAELVIISMAILIAFLWWLAVRLYRQKLAWQSMAYTLAEVDWKSAQQWEVRAMAAFVFEHLPTWLKAICTPEQFEAEAVSKWSEAVSWYGKNQPRMNSELFGEEDGPF